MINPFWSNSRKYESAYIITVKNHEKSERHSKECQESCDKVGMKWKLWDAYDGTKESQMIVPEHSSNSDFMKMLKITDHYLTRGEVACALSHISLWVHCVNLDQPIIILEHDAIVLKNIEIHESYNSIVYLGGIEWAERDWPVMSVPPHASEGPNYHFICRAHAYGIDPQVAKNLLAHVLKYGIVAPLDIMIRTDIFHVTHQGLIAYDKNYDKTNDTTIKARPLEGRSTIRNDNLEI